MQKPHPLKVFQASYGLTLDQLGKKFNKGSATMSRWLADESYPTQGDYFEFSKNYGRSIAVDLFRDWLEWIEHKRDSQ